jgi:hypothetical protein
MLLSVGIRHVNMAERYEIWVDLAKQDFYRALYLRPRG